MKFSELNKGMITAGRSIVTQEGIIHSTTFTIRSGSTRIGALLFAFAQRLLRHR